VITKRGKPVAELRPIPSRLNTRLIGCMKDRIRIRGDIFTTGIEWNAES
jgi:antitoxin (DNA-binding transcriptional repressor) of toxin-antitoxin stability system